MALCHRHTPLSCLLRPPVPGPSLPDGLVINVGGHRPRNSCRKPGPVLYLLVFLNTRIS